MACFPMLMRAFALVPIGLKFSIIYQVVRLGRPVEFSPLDMAMLRPVPESRKRNLWKFSTKRQNGSGQRWITFSAPGFAALL